MFRDPMQSVYTMACMINVSPSPLFNYLVFPSVSDLRSHTAGFIQLHYVKDSVASHTWLLLLFDCFMYFP